MAVWRHSFAPPAVRPVACTCLTWLLLSMLLVGARAPAAARTVQDLETIVQELEVAKDVFRSAMAHSVGKRLRITGVDAQYLAKQGVLVSMHIIQPWIDVDEFAERSMDLSTEVETLHDVPDLVYEIMTELNIAIAPYDPDLLDELRELREEQRTLRAAQRQLRSQLREGRRARNRLDDDTAALDEQIGELERELNMLVEEYEGLSSDIDELYDTLQRKRASGESATPVDLDQSVGETACNYAHTLKSLGSQEFLTVSIKFKGSTRYYVFRMENLNACRRGDIDAAKLLTRSWVYDA